MSSLRLVILSILISTPAFAGEALYLGIRNQFEGTRANGMGNAFTAVADDNTAIFYNPAGLSQLDKGESNWFIKLNGDPEILDFFDDISNASDQTDKETAVADVLNNNYGKHFSARLPSLGFLWARPTWGIAVILSDLSIDMGLHRAVGPSVHLRAINDTTMAYSQNWDVPSGYGKLNVGVTGKAIYRLEADKVVSVAEISQDGSVFEPEEAREGLTIDADVGALWTAPWDPWNLKAGITIRNLLDYGYLAQFSAIGDRSGKPENLIRRIDIGTALELPGWWLFSNTLALDFRNLLHPNASLMKSLHIGYELQWDVTSWWRGGWRAGFNQGYWALGFTGEFGIFKLDLASFGEEVGIEGNTIENRRYQVTMSLDF